MRRRETQSNGRVSQRSGRSRLRRRPKYCARISVGFQYWRPISFSEACLALSLIRASKLEIHAAGVGQLSFNSSNLKNISV
jgi:hypothetical protein